MVVIVYFLIWHCYIIKQYKVNDNDMLIYLQQNKTQTPARQNATIKQVIPTLLYPTKRLY